MKNNIATKIFLLIIWAIILSGSMIIAEQNKGTKDKVLYGGKSGEVPFPHHRHQDKLGDCNICHNLFPQVEGAIEELKTQGKLKKLQVMKQCLQCHKKMATAEEKTGPVKCNDCHTR